MGEKLSAITVVGASVAGWRVVDRLRSAGYAGSLTLIDAAPHLPYDRPPLSKQLLAGTRSEEDIRFCNQDDLADLDVGTYLGQRALALDGTTVQLADGQRVEADQVVVATGARARPWASRGTAAMPRLPAVGALRTLEDARWLSQRLADCSDLVIVGGGLIGAEVASTARDRGVGVTIIEALEHPMKRVLGAAGGSLVHELMAEHQVRFHGRTAVHQIEPAGAGARIEATGRTLVADAVVVGIGTIPNSAWVTGGHDGIRCDARGRVHGREGVRAVGDVAVWPDPYAGPDRRLEHWTSARLQAEAVVADLLGLELARPAPAYVWSDQFGMKIQVVGRPDLAQAVRVFRATESTVRGSAVAYVADGIAVGVALFGTPRRLGRATAMVAAAAPATELFDFLGDGAS